MIFVLPRKGLSTRRVEEWDFGPGTTARVDAPAPCPPLGDLMISAFIMSFRCRAG